MRGLCYFYFYSFPLESFPIPILSLACEKREREEERRSDEFGFGVDGVGSEQVGSPPSPAFSLPPEFGEKEKLGLLRRRPKE